MLDITWCIVSPVEGYSRYPPPPIRPGGYLCPFPITWTTLYLGKRIYTLLLPPISGIGYYWQLQEKHPLFGLSQEIFPRLRPKIPPFHEKIGICMQPMQPPYALECGGGGGGGVFHSLCHWVIWYCHYILFSLQFQIFVKFWTFNHSCGYSRSHLNLDLAEAFLFFLLWERERDRAKLIIIQFQTILSLIQR